MTQPKCGQRVHYVKHLYGDCVLPPHGDDVEHIVEIVSALPEKIDYTQFYRR